MDLKVAVGVCYGRSGSFFLHSLLDGHPEVISLPPYMMNLAQQIIDTLPLSTRDFALQFTVDFKNLFVDSLDNCVSNQYINLANNMARTQTGLLNLDANAFVALLQKQLGSTAPDFKARFIAIHLAIYQLLDIPTAEKRVIFYQLHTPNYKIMRLIRDSFGHLYICHSVREPISSFIRMCMAHIADLQQRADYTPQLGVNQMESCFRHFLYAGCDLTDNEQSSSLAIKLEALHENPRATMSAVCRFLDIQWHEILLEETINHGIGWQGIIGDTTGFNLAKTLENNQKYRQFVSEHDLIRLEKIARQRLLKWQYPLYFEHHRQPLDFEAPYTFEVFPWTDPSVASQCQDDHILSAVKNQRGDLQRALLKTLHYMPELFAPFSAIPTTESAL